MKVLNYLRLLVLLLIACSASAEIFKYQDEQGKWHFSDKKPELEKSTQVETLSYRRTNQQSTRPYIDVKLTDQHFEYWVHNPFYAPVEAFLRFENGKGEGLKILLEPQASKVMAKSPINQAKRLFHFRYVLGDPEAKPTIQHVLPPFTDFKPMRISQGFKGTFSHHREPSLFAVDISMPVGTKITAVQAGIVIGTKDDYHAAGITSGFFYDKANYVAILHEDGSYAFYGHLLLGGVKVKAGQVVEAGELIALSGNTGFSSGPHLHFVIRHNDQGRAKSLPFKFLQANKQALTPERGMWLLPFQP